MHNDSTPEYKIMCIMIRLHSSSLEDSPTIIPTFKQGNLRSQQTVVASEGIMGISFLFKSSLLHSGQDKISHKMMLETTSLSSHANTSNGGNF